MPNDKTPPDPPADVELPDLRIVSVIHDPDDEVDGGVVRIEASDDLGDYEVLGLLAAGMFRQLLYVCDVDVTADFDIDDEDR